MTLNKIGIWMGGYMDAIQNGEGVNKKQIQFLIKRLEELILETERASVVLSEENVSKPKMGLDDLPT